MKVIAKAVFFIDGDPQAHEYQSTVVEHSGKKWLVATWLAPNDGGERIPERLIPLEMFSPVELPNGLIRLGCLMQRRWLSQETPAVELQPLGMVVNPLLVRTQKRGNIH